MPDASTLTKLQLHLESRLHQLEGDWVRRTSNYERDLCERLGVTPEAGRYFDAKWDGHQLELKKGSSIWLDLVRYGEIATGMDRGVAQDSLTLFFVPDGAKRAISSVHCVTTRVIIEKMALDFQMWAMIALLPGRLPRSLNVQASLTVTDVARLAVFSVGHR